MKINERISYRDKKVFIGVDVHRRHYTVSCICDDELVKKCQIVAIPEQLLCLIKKYFSEAKVKVVYEAGFSGFRYIGILSSTRLTVSWSTLLRLRSVLEIE